MRKALFFLLLCTGIFTLKPAFAQLAFWNYDEMNNEATIPPECDATFDESRGGVFMPTVQELAQRGEEFLLNPNPVERNKAGYCLIAAALLGDIPSQYRVSQLYAKGIVLPQDDLSAYRWTFLASLNGHEEAAKQALLLERFLTTEEIELATSSIQGMLPSISSRYKQELSVQEERVRAKQRELDAINNEIDIMLGIKPVKSQSQKASLTVAQKKAQKATPKGSVFSESDRLK